MPSLQLLSQSLDFVYPFGEHLARAASRYLQSTRNEQSASVPLSINLYLDRSGDANKWPHHGGGGTERGPSRPLQVHRLPSGASMRLDPRKWHASEDDERWARVLAVAFTLAVHGRLDSSRRASLYSAGFPLPAVARTGGG